MKKSILIIAPIILIFLGLSYFNLPVEITRRADINLGNQLATNISEFEKLNGKLPESENWQSLEKLGFKMEMLGTNPTYSKISDSEFELIYLEGFDGPYLIYNSKSRDWKMGFPTPSLENRNLDNQLEESYPWSKKITQVALDAIQLSIENVQNHSENRDKNFPSNPYNFPFTFAEPQNFIIVGYSTNIDDNTIYWISFKPESEIENSGPYIVVEVNIQTEDAIQVYMIADA